MTPSELASPDGTHSGRTPSRIVVIDDEQDMRASISQWLSLSGFQPETYASAEEALAVLSADFPGIVVTDIRMPGMRMSVATMPGKSAPRLASASSALA